MNQSMDISICVVSYNTRQLLGRTLAAAMAGCQDLAAEMIVVDNNSVDGSGGFVRQAYPHIRLITNNQNRFFSAACNQAIERSTGEFVLLLNSDVELLPGTLKPLLADLRAHPEVGATTVRLSSPDGRVQATCARFLRYDYMLLEHSFLGSLLPGRRKRARSWRAYTGWDRLDRRLVEVAPGSFLLVRRNAFDVVGTLDENLKHYFSDEDWCLRLGQAGLKLAFLPLPGAIHIEGASSSTNPGLARRLYFDDMICYARKHFGRVSAALLNILTRPTQWGMEWAGKARRI